MFILKIDQMTTCNMKGIDNQTKYYCSTEHFSIYQLIILVFLEKLTAFIRFHFTFSRSREKLC